MENAKQLVFISNDRVVTDSLTIAEAFEKAHDKVLRDIRELGCSEEFRLANFGESSYTNKQGRKMPKVIVAQDGFALLVMGYTGKKAMEFKEKYIKEFRRMEELLKNPSSAKQQFSMEDIMIHSLQSIKMLKKQMEQTERDVSLLKLVVNNEVLLTENQKQEIQQAVNRRVRELRDEDYSDAHYMGIYGALKRHYGVAKYDKIPRKDFNTAMKFVAGWYPPKKQETLNL